MYHQTKKTFSDRLLSSTETFFQLISSYVLSQSPKDFVSLDTNVNKHTFLMDDCSLVSAFNVRGTKKAMKSEEYADTVFKLESAMKGYMANGDTSFEWSFELDTDKTKEEIEEVYGKSARRVANKIGFLSTGIIDEQVDVMARFCHTETNLLVVRTQLTSLTREEIQQLKELTEKLGSNTPKMTDAQNLIHGASYYLHRHEATLSALKDDFDNAGIWIDLETTHEYAYHLRNSYDSGFTDLSWRPALQGDKYTYRPVESGDSDYSAFGMPKLQDQLIPRMAERLTYTTMQIGDTYIAPFSVKYLPKKPLPFASFLRSIKKENIPFRLTYAFNKHSSNSLMWKVGLASLLSLIKHRDNKEISSAYDNLSAVQDAGGDFVDLRIHVSTWSRQSEQDAKKQREIIVKRLQSWGGIECESVEGDPVETFMSSIPGLTRGKTASQLPFELNETMQLMPISRPSSIWDTGSRILRTAEGKLFPTQPFSKQMDYWLKVILGPMGFGKSAELACDNFSLLLHPDFNELAYIRQIDVGTTSRGFIMLVRSLLPENQAYLAQYHRLQNTKEFQKNILDTLPTLRLPTSAQLGSIRDMLVTLALPDDSEHPYEGTYQVISSLIKLAYTLTSERATALVYRPGLIKDVDDELARLDFTPIRNKVFWWDVADFLYINNSPHQMLAQQQAVPDIPYLVGLTSNERLTNEFEGLTTPMGEPILIFIARKLSGAMDDYPILSGRTRWNLQGAKIISLDLDDVTRGKGPAANKQNTIFYTLATNILTSDFFLYEEQLPELPEKHGLYDINSRGIYSKEIQRLKRLAKRFCVDEVHRGGGITTFESMLETTTLEGRKGGIDIVLATQLVKAIPDSIVKLANAVSILGSGSPANVKDCVEKFQLEPSLQTILENEMRSPSASGATSLNIFRTKRGTVQHKLISTVGPGFLWRINSIQEDDYVRRQLGKVLGEDIANEILVKRYPSGTIEAEMERLRKNRGLEKNGDFESSIVDEIVNDNLRYFKTQYTAA